MVSRRAINVEAVKSAAFISLSASARLLFYDLHMHADDEGFVDAGYVVRYSGLRRSAIRELVDAGFAQCVENDILRITDWNQSGILRPERIKPSKYRQDTFRLEPPEIPIPKQHKEVKTKGKPSAPVPYEKIVDSYNSLCPSLPTCVKLSEQRRKSMMRFYKMFKDGFDEVFKKAEASDFLTGRNGKIRKVVDFDWVVNVNNAVRITEGKYDNMRSGPGSRPSAVQSSRYDGMYNPDAGKDDDLFSSSI